MKHKITPTGRLRKITLKAFQLCSQADCLSHAEYMGLYRRPDLKPYCSRLLCYDHAQAFLAPLMAEVLEDLLNEIITPNMLKIRAKRILEKL